MKNSKLTLFATLAALLFGSGLFAQENLDVSDNDLRIEVEPVSFALKGISGSISYNVTKDDNLSVGLFGAAIDVPDRLRASIFNNVGTSDTSQVRLGFELALNVRYRLRLFKQYESNPYIGLIFGWEYFDINQPSNIESVRLSTWLATPYVGYEFYVYKKMLYLNPQIRAVSYLGKQTSDVTRPEELGQFLVLPQVSVGIRF